MGTRKDKQKALCKELYFKGDMTQKELAEKIGVTPKTVGLWIKNGHWREERNARHNSRKERVNRIKDIISSLTDDHLEILAKIKHAKSSDDKEALELLRKQSAALSQEIAIQTKALERIDKEHKISLSTYLEVMENIFNAMREHDRELYVTSLDFQQEHLQNVAEKLG